MTRLILLAAVLLPQLAAAGWVTITADAAVPTPSSYEWRAGCVAPGQYELPRVTTALPSVRIENLPDRGRCWFAVRAVPGALSEEAIFDFDLARQIPSTPTKAPTISWDAAPVPTGARFVRLVVTKRRGVMVAPGNAIQLADVQLTVGASPVPWPISARATNPGGTSPGAEGPAGAIDANAATKWLDFNFSGSATSLAGTSTLLVDVGAAVTFNGYRWRTANDAPERDPVSWRLETAASSAGPWTVRSTVTDALPPAVRGAWTPTFGAL